MNAVNIFLFTVLSKHVSILVLILFRIIALKWRRIKDLASLVLKIDAFFMVTFYIRCSPVISSFPLLADTAHDLKAEAG